MRAEAQQDYAGRLMQFIADITAHGLAHHTLRAALVIGAHSYGQRMDAAQFASQAELAAILGVAESHCSLAIRELRVRAIVRCYSYAGQQCYAPLPEEGWQDVDTDLRMREAKPGLRRVSKAAWKTAWQREQRDPRQGELIPWRPADAGDCGFSAALAGAEKVTAPVTPPDENPKVTGAVTPAWGVGGPVQRAEAHGTGFGFGTERTPLKTQYHSHELESENEIERRVAGDGEALPRWRDELRPGERELYDKLEAIMEARGELMSPHFEHTWCERLRLSLRETYDAIADTDYRHRAGRITRSAGGCANRLWLHYTGRQKYEPQRKK